MSPLPCVPHRMERWGTCVSKMRAHGAEESAVTLTTTVV